MNKFRNRAFVILLKYYNHLVFKLIQLNRMEIFVNKDLVIESLSHQFKELFPFLRLEFSFNGLALTPVQLKGTLNEIAKKKVLTNFSFSMSNSVAELENFFWDNMGITVTVFRKSGKTWLETTYSSHWSLQKQNSLGNASYLQVS